MKIVNVDLKRKGSRFVVEVKLMAPTGGWTDVKLGKVQYVAQPADGLQEFVVTATPPTGIVDMMIHYIDLHDEMEETAWVRGVSVRYEADTTVLLMPVKNQPPTGNDAFSVTHAEIKGDKLLIGARYGGGCAKHFFQLNWDGMILESFPPMVIFNLTHNGNNDMCKALLTQELVFDLSALEGLPHETTRIIIQSPGGTHEVTLNGLVRPVGDMGGMPAFAAITAPAIRRGYSNSYDLGEAMKQAIAQLPDRSAGTVDYLATYTVVRTGAEKGGMHGADRMYVDVQG